MAPRKRVLIVDDDPAVSTAAAQMIRVLGHMAVVAWGVESALSIWEETERAFDFAIVDYVLKDGSGAALVERLKSEKPEMPVFLTSGMTEDDIDVPAGVRFLAKPYSLDDLRSTIDSL